MVSIDFSRDVSDTVRAEQPARARRFAADRRAWRRPARRRAHRRRCPHGARLGRRASVAIGGYPTHERRLEGVEPLGTLVKLLVLDAPARVDEARRAFAPLTLERLEELGILEVEGGIVRASIRIVPHDEILIASDRRLHTGETTRPDHVAGVHGPSLTLSHLTVRRPVAWALDVGTGSGIQAILAARHSEACRCDRRQSAGTQLAAFNATAQRKYATAQQATQQAARFLEISQQQERLGQSAHSDVIRAELQYNQQKQNFEEMTLDVENARLNLAVMLFATLNENFTVVDDLDSAKALPAFAEVKAMAKENPDLKVARNRWSRPDSMYAELATPCFPRFPSTPTMVLKPTRSRCTAPFRRPRNSGRCPTSDTSSRPISPYRSGIGER